MIEEDVIRLMIIAYELGRDHGFQASQTEQRQQDEWWKCKQEAKAKFAELTKS